ncbi:hypothetical protein M8J75_005602 [Diaphorina citri]|nr:hypothetical protein M8J75_005602 [Diaphorina citri]
MNTLLNCTEMILFVKCFYSAISWEFYALLDSMCVPYEVFNVSYDMAVEEYLKNCWNITTYPQLFLFGYCVGNFEKVRKIKNDKKCFPHLKKAIDVINERHKCGVDLVAFASHRVEKMLEENDIVVFLEDDGAKPCSCDTRQVLDILNETDLPFITFNVQQDGHIRRKVREISNWESFPQVFSHGHFVGGVNMMTVLKNQNELVPLLKAECRLDNCGKKITTPVKLPNSDSDDYIV